MDQAIWLTRNPPVTHSEFQMLSSANCELQEVDEKLVSSPHGNLLHFADPYNHLYWIGHPSGHAIPFSLTQWGIFCAITDPFVIDFAEGLATALGAQLSVREVAPNNSFKPTPLRGAA